LIPNPNIEKIFQFEVNPSNLADEVYVNASQSTLLKKDLFTCSFGGKSSNNSDVSYQHGSTQGQYSMINILVGSFLTRRWPYASSDSDFSEKNERLYFKYDFCLTIS